MASKIPVKINEKEFELEKGEPIKKYCEEAGVPFGCESGECGACMIEVKKGSECLSEITEQEKDLGIEEKDEDGKCFRLACQCKIKEDSKSNCDKIEIEGYI